MMMLIGPGTVQSASLFHWILTTALVTCYYYPHSTYEPRGSDRRDNFPKVLGQLLDGSAPPPSCSEPADSFFPVCSFLPRLPCPVPELAPRALMAAVTGREEASSTPEAPGSSVTPRALPKHLSSW